MSSGDSIAENTNGTSRTLGVFWLVYGLFRLIMVLGLLIYGATATLMFGALLNRVPDPFALMGVFHFLYMAVVVLSVVCGVLGVIAGLSLLAGQQAGRKFALIAAVLSVCDIPLGTTLGIYTLVVLLPSKNTSIYGRSGHAV